MMIPLEEPIPLKPVTAISRPTIKKTIHAGTRFRGISMISAAEISNLSAMGSSKRPITVTVLLLRAKKPSKKSVREAAENMKAAKRLDSLLGSNRKKIMSGTEAILAKLRLLGILNISSLRLLSFTINHNSKLFYISFVLPIKLKYPVNKTPSLFKRRYTVIPIYLVWPSIIGGQS